MKTVLSSGSVKYCMIKTGQYIGDGTTGQKIAGLGFRPKIVWIWQHSITGAAELYMKLDTFSTDFSLRHKSAGSEHAILDNRLISLDDDGFTVDDDATDQNPNQLNQTYDYLALG